MLLLPASNAMIGVMQQSEAAMADNTPALVYVPDDFKPVSYTHLDVYKRQTTM